MKLERLTIGKKSWYTLNGKPIAQDTLWALGEEFFTKDKWQQIAESLRVNGCAETTLTPWQESADQEIALANKKIAALEKRVAKLTLDNIYLTA